MANIKSAKKDVRRILKKTEVNAARKSRVRTFLKKAKAAVLESKTYKEGFQAIAVYESEAMRAAKNNLFSKKSIDRRKKVLASKLKSRFSKEEQII